MEQTSIQQTQIPNLSFNVEKYPLVEITRKFAAPVERLWQAWTEPELMKQWWGPEHFTCPDARLDVREGGTSILAMKDPDGKVQYSGGTYLEVIPNRKIVTTDQFTTKEGEYMSPEDAGMPGDWPDTMRVTIEFKNLGPNESQLSIVHEGIPKDMHDDCVSGWSTSIDKLQRLVEHS